MVLRCLHTSIYVFLSSLRTDARRRSAMYFEITRSPEEEAEDTDEFDEFEYFGIDTILGAIEPVVDLTPYNFPTVKSHPFVDHWLVSYCHNWYTPCQKSNLNFKKTAWEYLLRNMDDPIRFASVDCSKHKTLCNERNVHSFPTVQHFYKGRFAASLVGSDPITFTRLLSDIAEANYEKIFPPAQVVAYFYNLSRKKSIKPEIAQVEYLMYGSEDDDGSSGKLPVTEAYVKFQDGNMQVVPVTFLSPLIEVDPNYGFIAALLSISMVNAAFLLTVYHIRMARTEARHQHLEQAQGPASPEHEAAQPTGNTDVGHRATHRVSQASSSASGGVPVYHRPPPPVAEDIGVIKSPGYSRRSKRELLLGGGLTTSEARGSKAVNYECMEKTAYNYNTPNDNDNNNNNVNNYVQNYDYGHGDSNEVRSHNAIFL